MSFYKRNKKAILKKSNNYKFAETTEEFACYTVEDAKSGDKTIKYSKDGKTLYFHSKFDPKREAERLAGSYKDKIEDKNIVIIFGMGLGYAVNAFLELIGNNNMLIIIEPSDDIFHLAMIHTDVASIINDRRVNFYAGHDIEDFTGYIKAIIYEERYENLIYFSSAPYKEMFQEFYKEASEMLLEHISDLRIGRQTAFGWGHIWTNTIIANLRHSYSSINSDAFMNIFKGVPAIIVAAGPSLDKNIDRIKELKGKFFIIAVYTALKSLKRHGIEPDFFVTLDSTQTKFENEATQKEQIGSNIIYLMTANTDLLDRCAGEKVMITDHGHLDMLESITGGTVAKAKYRVGYSGTVASLAICFAAHSGANPIIFTGLDLSYSETRTHVSGSFYDDEKGAKMTSKILDEAKIYVDGVNGEKVKTDLVMKHYLQGVEETIKIYSGVKFIDATEGGALKKGAENMTLAQVIEEYGENAELKVPTILQNLFDKEEKLLKKDDLPTIFENAGKQAEIIWRLDELMTKGLKIAKQIEKVYVNGSPNKVMVEKWVDELTVLDKDMNENLSKTTLFENIIPRIEFQLNTHQPHHEENEQLYFARHCILLYNNMLLYVKDIHKALENIKNWAKETMD